jgi:hypothetical protein
MTVLGMVIDTFLIWLSLRKFIAESKQEPL